MSISVVATGSAPRAADVAREQAGEHGGADATNRRQDRQATTSAVLVGGIERARWIGGGRRFRIEGEIVGIDELHRQLLVRRRRAVALKSCPRARCNGVEPGDEPFDD